jgi:competence protein ComEC
LFSAISLTAALFFSLTEANADDMRFAALDVGQGQCLAITAKGYAAVIDCGGSSARNAGDLAAEYLSSLGRTRLDCLILTHCHEDHAGGAAELIRRLRVGKLIVPRVADAEGDLFAEIAARASERGTEIITIGDQIYSFQESGLSFTLVPPLGGSGENELYLCALVSCGDFDCLVTGDIGSETELRLIERLDLPDVELMMAGHHGSKYSTSRELLEAARPEAVVISVGHNIYGHPSEETLDRLAAWNGEVRVYRTDELGDITVTYDGGQQ